jgi:tRNA A-37 threonylcarbamoyl transferase component Bud32
MMLPSAFFIVVLFLVVAILMAFVWRRSYLVLNPTFADHLKKLSLDNPEAILELPAVIVSGHPDRNVSRICLGDGSEKLRAFLKREHQVRLKERLLNAIAGFGFVSKSHREAVILSRAQGAGILCPEWIAFGQTGKGQAFLLVAALTSCVDVRNWLARSRPSLNQSLEFSKALGRKLAQVHNAGFFHSDLYAKHVLVHEKSGDIYFLDWQRSQRYPKLSWNHRYRDLAALHATLPEDATTPKSRLVCLLAYLRESRKREALPTPCLRLAAETIQKLTPQLLTRRHIRQARQTATTQFSQNVIWLNGEALCVTPDFLKHIKDQPDLLKSFSTLGCRSSQVERKEIALGNNQPGILTCRRERRLGALLRNKLLGKKWTAPEVRQAGLLFRLQRLGIATPRLLAFGQTYEAMGVISSFILIGSTKNQGPTGQSALSTLELRGLTDHRSLIRNAAFLLKLIHEAGCHFIGPIEIDADFVSTRLQELTVGLGRMDNLDLLRGKGRGQQKEDLLRLVGRQSPLVTSRTDVIRLVRAYLGVPRLDCEGKALAFDLLRHSSPRPRTTKRLVNLGSLLARPVRLTERASA